MKFKQAAIMALTIVVLMVMGSTTGVQAIAFGARGVNLALFGERVTGAVLFEGRTYVPAAALQGILGYKVEVHVSTMSLLINSELASHKTTGTPGSYKGYQSMRVYINEHEQPSLPPAIYHEGTAYVPLRLLEQLGVKVGWDQSTHTAYAGTLSLGSLPTVGSKTLLERLLSAQTGNDGRLLVKSVGAQESAPPAADSARGFKFSSTSTEFSGTNVQVAGVDEADIVKTDGEYIYQVRGRVVSITRAYPVEDMKVLTSLTFEDERFFPQEIFVDDKYLVVIGQSDNAQFHEKQEPVIKKSGIDQKPAAPAVTTMIMPGRWWWGSPTVKAIVYDISDRSNIKLVRDVEIEGSAITARKIGSRVYLLSNKWANGPVVPYIRDSATSKEFREIKPEDIKYFPDRISPNYMLIAAFDLSEIAKGSVVSAYLGAGDNVYMSHENLFVAVGRFNGGTMVHKFSVKGTDVDYVARGEVKGNILNQFSMDEHKNHFRIATTVWGEKGLSNNVYVLNNKMETVGTLENIAPNERIYSARFMGDKGYLVTFELVDPLFVIDLSRPERPEILGALKIPGFSNYLHPLDENHLLGIGKDTDVIDSKDHTGKVVGQVAIELGMKLAIFDVSDVKNPIEKHVEIIGGRGTRSDVLHNHRALLFDERNNLLAFPVTIHAPVASNDFNWGPFEFQGAVVYEVSLSGGFTLRDRISHLSKEDMDKMGYSWHGGEQEIRRVLYIGEHLYFISDNMITAHTKANLKEVQRLVMPTK